jgi:6-phosphogluconate dehydrogenase
MQVGMIGLGRMGMNMARRLLRGGHQVVAYNRSEDKTREIAGEGAIGVPSLEEMAKRLSPPRVSWTMLPAGQATEEHLSELGGILSPGDILVDGSNSPYKDAIRREGPLAEKGIRFLDVGVSGGIWGLEKGYCLMVGGDRESFLLLEPLFRTLAPDEGYLHCGPIGAGHFVKMIHNGIEYGLMQAYAEGFDLMENSPYGKHLDYGQVAHLWNQGSVVRSWLLELAETAFSRDPRLSGIRGYVEDSGEGRWTVQHAVETGTPAPVITLSLMQRFRSRREDTFGDRVLAALRREFGGHAVVSSEKGPG